MSERVVIAFARAFDPGSMQVAKAPLPQVLLSWDARPDPIDAGAPAAVEAALAGALLTLGAVLFADREPPPGAERAALTLRRSRWAPLAWRTFLVRARTAEAARRAFDATGHPWSQAAQWIVVAAWDAAVDGEVTSFVERLHVDWVVPEAWPAPVRCVVQAGVDGDVAALTCRDEADLAALRAAIEERMAAVA